MPYRIDLSLPRAEAFDILVESGALEIEAVGAGLAAILPDSVSPRVVAVQCAAQDFTVSPAIGRDGGSVWMLHPRTARAGGLLILPADADDQPNALRLADSAAFGTGHHPTTALCLDALQTIVSARAPDSMLDVGAGSGILALAALRMGVPRALGLDTDAHALQAAAENARLNGLACRIELILGGPDRVRGRWPLVVANILAAPLIEMAPALVQRLGPGGRLILSGIRSSVAAEVRRAYQHSGIRHIDAQSRAGWTLLTAEAPW